MTNIVIPDRTAPDWDLHCVLLVVSLGLVFSARCSFHTLSLNHPEDNIVLFFP